MGRPAQPAQLKVLKGRGNGKDIAGRPIPAVPNFDRGAPEPPEWLSDEARAEWDRVAPSLDRLDLLKPEDRAVFTAYCETWATYKEAIRDVRAVGLKVVNCSTRKDGSVSEWVTKNPSVGIAETAATHLRALGSEFGLGAASELKLAKAPKPDDGEQQDPYGESAAS